MSSPSSGPAPPLAPLFPLVNLYVTNASPCYVVNIQFDSWDYLACPAGQVTCSPVVSNPLDINQISTNKIVNEVAGYVRASFTLSGTNLPTLTTGMVFVPINTRAAAFNLYTLVEGIGAQSPGFCFGLLTVVYKTMDLAPTILNARYLYVKYELGSCASAPPSSS
jgi:hypothetical protein